ncbi:MAG TPA: hypothetical protein VHR35_05595 [Nocardioides sp.]|jgi:hypothetical protein|nr:hypothetical protein [Nocardioides sp.]HEX3295645.1 hypothetical protein [Nocardioides sp.]
MTGTPPSPVADNYEIVVRGVVGDAVRAALLPARAASAEREAVLHTRLLADDVLADLVAALWARGLRIASIAVLD